LVRRLWLNSCCSGAESSSLARGAFITCDIIQDKRSLASLLPAGAANPVVEMESAAIARVTAEHGIPFLGVRTISDPWDEELDFTIDEFCDDTMRIRPTKVLATILRRPRIIPQLIRLALNSRVAAAGLAKAMQRLLHQI
jgi:adenosylhomocysteine nucleosidase